MKITENPNDPGSFAFVMHQILGESFSIPPVAADLKISERNLSEILSGKLLPIQSLTKDWPDKLHPKYNLERVCEETGFTLRQMLEEKISGFKRGRGGANIDPFNSEIYNLLWIIGGRRDGYLNYLASMLCMSRNDIVSLAGNPEVHSRKALQQFIDRLLETFPDNRDEVLTLRVLLGTDEPTLTGGMIKNEVKNVRKGFREAAGILIRELREKFEDSVEDLEARICQPRLRGKIALV